MAKTDTFLAILLKTSLFCAVIYFPLFLHLDVMPLRLYDESRNALNAAEMMQNGNWIVTYYNGTPDMWNTKPPLLIWTQTVFFKLLGPNELALRLPSAIAAVLTCLSLLIFSIKHLKSYWFGLIASVILVTSSGYVAIHGTRTGDYDPMLTLFITLFSLSAFAYTESRERKSLFFFFLFLTLAALTKGVQAFIIAPAIFVYAAVRLWRRIHWSDVAAIAIGGLLSVLTIAAYYLLREHHNPGYLLTVWQNELGGRYMEVTENNTGGFFFYLQNIVDRHFNYWYWLVPIGALLGVFSSKQKLKRIAVFVGFMVLWYWLIISSSQTKLYWYALPLYPFLSLLAAIPIYAVFKTILRSASIHNTNVKKVGAAIFLVAVFAIPYTKAVSRVYFPQEYPWDVGPYSIFYYLKQPTTDDFNLDGKTICYDFYNSPLEFYQIALAHKGVEIELIHPREIELGDTLLVFQPEVIEHLDSTFEIESSVVFGNSVWQYIIKGERERF